MPDGNSPLSAHREQAQENDTSFIGRFGAYFTRRHPDWSTVSAVWPL